MRSQKHLGHLFELSMLVGDNQINFFLVGGILKT